MPRVVRTDFTVVAEKEEWLVVGKPAPLMVHPTNDSPEVTLLGVLQARCPGQAFHFINRLDRETSGCVLVAKTKEAAGILGKQMEARTIGKTYRAIIQGWPDWERKVVSQSIVRKGEVEKSLVWVRRMVHETGKVSTTHFVLEECFENESGRFSVVRCLPETGRTHQLRVHLEYLEHPIVGDKIYGGDERCYVDFMEGGWSPELEEILLIERQALHGDGLSFDWEGERIEVECPWPEDMEGFRYGRAVCDPT